MVHALRSWHHRKANYHSRRQQYTISIQAIAGSNLIFLDVAICFPGSTHDARILRSSQVLAKSEAGEILIKLEKVISNKNFRSLISGDGAYLQTSWLIKPYLTIFAEHRKKTGKRSERKRENHKCITE